MGAVKNLVSAGPEAIKTGFESITGQRAGERAAERGAAAMERATTMGVEEQRAAREQIAQQLAPYMGAGTAAQSQLLELLGIRDPAQAAAYEQARAFQPQFSDKERAMIIQAGPSQRGRGGGAFFQGTKEGASASKADADANARYQQAIAERDMLAKNQQLIGQYESFQPSERFGMLTRDITQGLPSVMPGNIEQDSLFQSLKRQAISGIEGSAAARGKLFSGTTPQAIAEQVQNLGLQRANQIQAMNLAARGQLFGERAGEQQRQYQQLFGLVGTGQASAAQQAANLQGAAANIGELYAQQANARAAGLMAQANLKAQAFQGLMSAAGSAAGAAAASDRRVKEDIKQVGTLDNGLPVYTFRYKGGSVTHMGVMAQDVEQVNPDAVTEIDGIKHVYYGAL
jgi:hypothetical protein